MNELVRRLEFKEAFALVVGSVIGTGVFLKSAEMLSLTGSANLVLLAWFLAGVISLMGAFCYAELGSRFPRAGGEYVYLKEAYGEGVAFLYGWMRFWIGAPGSIAAYGVGAATFFSAVIDLEHLGVDRSSIAIGTILIFSAINCLSVKTSGGLQAFLTFLKIIIVAGFGFVLFQGQAHWSSELKESVGGASGFGAAMLAALWAYDGWNNMPMAAGEIKNPERNIPKALVTGMLLILFLYLLVNAAYFYALPAEEIANSYSKSHPQSLPVASRAAQVVLGNWAVWILSLVFVVSALGSMTGSILTGARVPFAMAKDQLFFDFLSKVHPTTRVPTTSVLIQGVIASLLAYSGTFDQLTDYVVFSSWIFYGLAAASIFKFRTKKTPDNVYLVPFYPWVPGIFVVSSAGLLLNTLWSTPVESGVGLLIILTGIPVYLRFKRSKVLKVIN